MIYLFFILTIFIGNISANEITFSVEVHNVTINGGNVHGAIYSNNNTYRNSTPEFTFINNSTNNVLIFNLKLPEGEYAIQVYQDTNNNGKLDFGIFNIPKEPVGISNWNGSGIPGNFDRHKVTITNETKIVIQLN